MGTARYDDAVTRTALAAKAGDRQAAGEFIRATYPQVRRFLAHLCPPGEVDDLAQETYLRAMRALGRFAARSSALTWLLAIARRVAADQVRAATRRPRTTPLDGHLDTAEAAAARNASGFEGDLLLRHLLAGLAPERREAFVATQMLGLSYEETAEVCGCPVGTIRSRVARARADLVLAYGQERRQDPVADRSRTAP